MGGCISMFGINANGGSNMLRVVVALLSVVVAGLSHAAPERLFFEVGPPETAALPTHTESARSIRLNRAALHAPSLVIELDGQALMATRTSFDRSSAGQHIWYGYLQGNPADTVILTLRGSTASGLIQHGSAVYRIGFGGDRLLKVDIASLPADDVETPLDGGGESLPSAPAAAGDGNIVQDLLVAYTQGACSWAGGCAALEADITTAVADLNNAYSASGINITMNLVGMALTDYAGTNASTALNDLRGNGDGQMDELHPLRDQLGADIVALIYDGEGCGIGYLSSSASSAFNVTDVPCLVGNRTMAHEIGHNQGAHHDRVTAGAGSSASFNYGYRRCNDTSVDATSSPWFRTVMSYSCSGAPRVGHFSNPNVDYLGVSTGVDHNLVTDDGAWNALTLNNSAAYVAGFRASAQPANPPAGPTGLTAQAVSADTIDLVWQDNAPDETAYDVERSANGGLAWALVASLPSETTSFSDSGLAPDTTYHYRVAARNSGGASPYSNTAFATTLALPSMSVTVAASDSPSRGAVAGSFTHTHAADGVVQVITETTAGGPRNRRKQAFTHAWSFDVAPGGMGGVMVQVEAWVSGSEGALFAYSTDGGGSWVQMFAVSAQSPGAVGYYDLPVGTSGQVLIQVTDASQENGEAVDAVSVDAISITSINEVGEAPTAPALENVVAVSPNTAEVSFTDGSDNEFGFEILRADSAPVNCDAGAVVGSMGASAGAASLVVFEDNTAVPDTTHWYWARSYNAAGAACSSSASALMPSAPPPSLEMTVVAYKLKGRQQVDVSWSNASAGVEIYRDGTLFSVNSGVSGTYTDAIGVKGGGSYQYKVCEAGTAESACSAVQTVTF